MSRKILYRKHEIEVRDEDGKITLLIDDKDYTSQARVPSNPTEDDYLEAGKELVDS